ncbi:hypothetical protein IFM47457_01756 [Aspergillus lentulus]|nr:hypothetical protein IFM47457_01756 [Aspergillus lentulus]
MEEEESSEYSEEGEDKEQIHDFRGVLVQGSLNNNPLNLWKHTTISEDRTSESGWRAKQLAIVLPQVARDSSDQTKKSIAERDLPYFNPMDHMSPLGPSSSQRKLPEKDLEAHLRWTGKEKSNSKDRGISDFGPAQRIAQVSNRSEIEDQEFPSARNNEEEVPTGSMGHYQLLTNRIQALEQENIILKSWIDPDSIHRGRPFFQIVYRFKGDDKIFFKPPSWMREHSVEGNRYTLKGGSLSMKETEYLKRSSNLAFVIFQSYTVVTLDDRTETPILPGPEAETVLFASDEMRRAVQNYLSKQPDFEQLFPLFDVMGEIPSPYLFWYSTRSSYDSVLQVLPSHQRALVELFGEWVNANYEKEYAHVNDQIERGVVSCRTMKYLVRPGDPLVCQETSLLQAYQATSWAKSKVTLRDTGSKEGVGGFDKVWEVSAWSYEFDGVFYQKTVHLDIELDARDPDEEVALSALRVTLLDHASSDIREKLELRGKTCWACRKKRFISYRGGDDIESLSNNSERFMVDFPTYRQLHPPEHPLVRKKRTEIPPERLEADDPPSAPEIYLFPSRIVGYNFRRKKWVNLQVDLIQEVEWNKKAFESLVIDQETKELVQALITNRLVAEKGTDLIEDKGNGLTILLHGGPGTGKTFTAESVAELAEKPLYRVTCGDIGTQPEDVEKYLESALHLGKIWDCVVLLDEADVFLQERTLSDLQRNALVTVFLRVLEYYDGILILTSNRVGTFDEAFKSRIQVSLHYPNLNRSQRHKIWRNMINRLRTLEQPNIDFDDIDCYISELAEQEMNGRQIRNAITTARQLAKFKDRNMTHADLKHVIDVAGRFDKYLYDVKEGFTDDAIARDSGLR